MPPMLGKFDLSLSGNVVQCENRAKCWRALNVHVGESLMLC